MASADTRLISTQDAASIATVASAEVLGDGLTDAVGDGALQVVAQILGPGGFATAADGATPYAPWPAAACADAAPLWDRLADALPAAPSDSDSPTAPERASVAAGMSRRRVVSQLADDEIFVPQLAPSSPAGGAVSWPGAGPL